MKREPADGSRKVSPSRVVNIEDLRNLAQRRLPRVVFDYLDGGAEAEFTLRANSRAFEAITFRPRQAVAAGECDLRTQVLGCELSFPAMLAPIGYSRLIQPDGELAAARAADSAGIGYILSTFGGHKLEDVKAAIAGPAWYQLYLVGGREVAEAGIERARNAGFSALVITVDTPVAGMRERDVRNGMSELLAGNIFSKLPFLLQFLTRPRWLASFLLDGGLPKLENVVVPGQGPMPLMDVSAALTQEVVTWSDLSWIRKHWSGPIVVKGILTGDDARRAADEGAAAIVVSNHGGRQLDSAPAALSVLPEILEAVKDQVEVLIDGGIRRGTDIVKAIAMGARAVLLGRSYAYGLACAGEAGVTRALNIFQDDMKRTLRLLGCTNIAELDSSLISYPRQWRG